MNRNPLAALGNGNSPYVGEPSMLCPLVDENVLEWDVLVTRDGQVQFDPVNSSNNNNRDLFAPIPMPPPPQVLPPKKVETSKSALAEVDSFVTANTVDSQVEMDGASELIVSSLVGDEDKSSNVINAPLAAGGDKENSELDLKSHFLFAAKSSSIEAVKPGLLVNKSDSESKNPSPVVEETPILKLQHSKKLISKIPVSKIPKLRSLQS